MDPDEAATVDDLEWERPVWLIRRIPSIHGLACKISASGQAAMRAASGAGEDVLAAV
jgi:hypothetical protein